MFGADADYEVQLDAEDGSDDFLPGEGLIAEQYIVACLAYVLRQHSLPVVDEDDAFSDEGEDFRPAKKSRSRCVTCACESDTLWPAAWVTFAAAR